jgi:hypothetical protein
MAAVREELAARLMRLSGRVRVGTPSRAPSSRRDMTLFVEFSDDRRIFFPVLIPFVFFAFFVLVLIVVRVARGAACSP